MQKTSTVTVPFMLLGILFNICLVASNLLETKVIQVFGITATAGLIVFPISYIINDCIAEVWGFKKARLIIWVRFEFPCNRICAIGGTVACRPILGRRRRLQLRVRDGAAHRYSEPDGLSCRFVPECLCDE